MSNRQTAASTRRANRERERSRARAAGVRSTAGRVAEYGIELRRSRPGGSLQERLQLRWTVDPDPFVALMAASHLVGAYLPELQRSLVATLREDGYSWDDVGFALGVTGEAARLRYRGGAS